jgi:NCS1 family nucleobase:cation symporter-1
MDMLLDKHYSSGTRAGVFFLALGFTYASAISTIFENSIPAGNDLAALWPRFITIRRGFYIAAIISYAMCPWYILGSASSFVSWLASYQYVVCSERLCTVLMVMHRIFLSSITGVMLCQYFLVSKGYFDVPDLYTSSSSGRYYYYKGWNYRAYIAYIIGIAPNFYGFLGVFGLHITEAATRMYYFAYPMGLVLSFSSYYALCLLDPPPYSRTKGAWQEPRQYVGPDDVLDGLSPGYMVESIVVRDPGPKGY